MSPLKATIVESFEGCQAGKKKNIKVLQFNNLRCINYFKALELFLLG